MANSEAAVGRITQVIGAVVDVKFDGSAVATFTTSDGLPRGGITSGRITPEGRILFGGRTLVEYDGERFERGLAEALHLLARIKRTAPLGIGCRHHTQAGMRLGRQQLDLEVAAEARFVAEHRCHLGERVAGNHDQIT